MWEVGDNEKDEVIIHDLHDGVALGCYRAV